MFEFTRPIQERSHVSYHRDFLDQYRPNVTFYLSDSIRSKLLELGKTDGNRPAGTFSREIYNRLLIDLSWNSSRLEGNTYSLLETERLLELGEAAAGKDRRETQMILNHKGLDKKLATELIRQQAKGFVPAKNQARFIEIVETELMNLHEGNISRYGLRRSEYETWLKKGKG